jgi:sulfur-carrier protein
VIGAPHPQPLTTSRMNSLDPEITVTIKLFAVYQEAFGTAEISRQFPPNIPVCAVLEQLILDRPTLAQWRDVTKFGINLEFVDPDTIICDQDEIVLIPPVSGG